MSKKTTSSRAGKRRIAGGKAGQDGGAAPTPESHDAPSLETEIGGASFPVVGIGASAGGLEAFTALLTALPPDTGMAFVLIQHMDPKHASVLTDLLQKTTPMPVREVTDGMAVQPNHIYVIPPNTLMTISKGVLSLGPRNVTALRNLPIDHFFRSLADDFGRSAIGVILSGTASDGTQGLKAIKAQGGIAFAQDQESAQHKSMPLSAVTSGCVDFVLPPQRIAAELARLNGHPYLRSAVAVEEPAETGEDGIRKICTLLRTTSGVDFRLYKPATISRRIARRMALRKVDTREQYAQLLVQDRNELNALYDDIFIHVTGFFRDSETMQALQEAVFARILSGKEPAQIRIWVPGCSTGEEVYSLAMLLFEQLGDRRSQATIQFFGTDISDRAIERARSGIYADASMAEVSPERQGRFFSKAEAGFQVAKLLRDVCVFARHDLAKDPPFSNLNLISCRNVLIYMGTILQKRAIEAFHYALKPDGHLLLGKSESLSMYSHLFSVEDSKHKIFSRRPFSSPLRLNAGLTARPEALHTPAAGAATTALLDSRREAERLLLDQFAPAALVIDPKLQIIHFQGNTSPYLRPATGEPSFHLLRMVAPEFVADLRTAIHQAKKDGVEVRRTIRLTQNGTLVAVEIRVNPLKGNAGREPDYLVVFQTAPGQQPHAATPLLQTPAQAEAHADVEIERRDRELASMREQLRAMIHDHEAANEELRAMNEEVLSGNEELQSANEELETAKEEAESSNEELTTLNDELQQRNAELTHLADDLGNLLMGVNIPILFLDIGLRIRRFTPPAGKVLNLIATDVGRPLTDIAATLDGDDWGELAHRAIQHSEVIEEEVRDREGRWYVLRMRPYKTSDQKTEGLLVALLDIDAVKRSLEDAREARDFAEAIVETVREPLLVLDAEFRVARATGSFYEAFGVSRDRTEGKILFDLGNGQWNIPRLRAQLEEVLPRDSRFEGFEVEHEFPSIGYRHMILNARQIRRASGNAPMILLAIEDVTDRTRSDQARLAATRDEERRRIARELHDDLVQRLAGVAMELGGHAPGPALDPQQHEKETRAIQGRVIEAAEIARRIAYQLHPSEVEDLGLEGALRAYCESMSADEGIAVKFTSRKLPEQLKPGIASCLYRVAQESLRNVVKHAKAQRAKVNLEGTATLVRLSVEDNGIGFAAVSRHDGEGLGIVSMKERVRLAGGKFSIESAPGKGTRVLVEVPL